MAGTAVRYEVSPASDHENLVTQNVHTLSETPSLLPPSADELHGLPRSAGYNLSAEPKGASVSLEENTGNIEERGPVGQVFEDRAKEYRTWAEIAIVASVLFCFFPFSFICLVVAYLSSKEATKRNDEKDYISAKACGIWTLVWSSIAVAWGALWGLGFIAFLAGVAS